MPHQKHVSIEVVIVTFKRCKLLHSLLLSLPESGIDKLKIIINGPDQRTLEYLESLDRQNLEIIKLVKPLSPAAARNIALVHSESDWLLFLDDDVILPEQYFPLSLSFLRNQPSACAFGGHDWVYPNCSAWEFSLNITLTSPLATAHTRYRHHPKGDMPCSSGEADLTLCNLWLKRQFLADHSLTFDEELKRNEENILLDQIELDRGEVWRCPNLFVHHKRRSHFFAAMKSVFLSGKFRLQSILKTERLNNLFYLAPLVAFTFFIFCTLFSLTLGFILLALYLVITALVSAFLCFRFKKISLFAFVWINHWGINLSYALGSLWGVLIFRKKTSTN